MIDHRGYTGRCQGCGCTAFKAHATHTSAAASYIADAPSIGRARHIAGAMNKLEAKYSEHLEWMLRAGDIIRWRFEPQKLRLAPKTYFDVDFMVTYPGNRIEMHEVKGHWEDDARVKIKVAAKEFPEYAFVGVMWDKQDGWKFEKFKS